LRWIVWSLVNPAERRLRAGWRLFVQVALILVVSRGANLLLAVSVHGLQRTALAAQPLAWQLSLWMMLTVASFAVAVFCVWLARRWVDRRSFASLGLSLDRWTCRDLAVGLVIAGLMQAAVFALEWAAGWLRVEHFAWQLRSPGTVVAQMAVMTAVFALVGFYEELQMRGYLLQNVAAGLNDSWGLVLSSSLFALGHVFNPHASGIALVGLVGAGLFLGLAYLRTRSLWLSIGLHFGWNLFEGPVFGFQVSGRTAIALVEQTVSGPELWTGGAFGPEAGLVQIASLALGIAAVWLYTRRRSQWPRLARAPAPVV
jgi:membrane protease YdiL (CAAX protease family)